MTKAEILAHLPTLKAEERQQVFQRLCELQDDHLLHGIGPSAEEKGLLDQALAEFQRDGNPGTPWREGFAQNSHFQCDVKWRVSMRPVADADLAAARDWYERQRRVLGAEFLASVAEAFLS